MNWNHFLYSHLYVWLIPELDRLDSDTARRRLVRQASQHIRGSGWYAVFITVLLVVTVLFTRNVIGVFGLTFNLGTVIPVGLAVGIALHWGRFIVFRPSLRAYVRRRLADQGYPICIACGFDMRGTTDPQCPACGTSH